ncbi:MAG: permease-like cell division protein FtsX [Erysipelotrichaceae bacterium]|nr:permease-like cell division protein FtsX [Erysipelotrichaceae bacterium]
MFRLIGRHFKEAFQGIFRHFSSSLNSITAVTVTLVLVSLLTLIIGNVSQITRSIEGEIKIFVTVEESIEDDEIPALTRKIENVEGVSRAEFSNKDTELDKLITSFGEEGKLFEIYREDNPLHRAFIVSLKEGYIISDVAARLEKIDGLMEVNFGGISTEEFLKILNGVRQGGYVLVAALTLVAIFLIQNTINQTIFNRRLEISIMRQVGASNSYIRQPFVIEGIFIGIMGSVLPVLATIFGYKYVYEAVGGQLVSGMLALQPVNPFAYYVSAFLVAVGIIVGLIGSFLSVNKHLRWRR